MSLTLALLLVLDAVATNALCDDESGTAVAGLWSDDCDASCWGDDNGGTISTPLLPSGSCLYMEFGPRDCVTREFHTPVEHSNLDITLNYYAMCSWDSGCAQIKVDGTLLENECTRSLGSCGAWEHIQSEGVYPFDMFSCVQAYPESQTNWGTSCQQEFSVRYPHTSVSDSYLVEVCSTTDEAVNNEAFGFSDISINPVGGVTEVNALWTDDCDTDFWMTSTPGTTGMLALPEEGLAACIYYDLSRDNAQCVTRRFRTGVEHTDLKLSLRYYALSTWDTGNWAVVTLAGEEVLRDNRNSITTCSSSSGNWAQFDQDEAPFSDVKSVETWKSPTYVSCYQDVLATVPHTSSDEFELTVCAVLDEGQDNEQFAFSHLNIEPVDLGLPCEEVLPPTDGLVAHYSFDDSSNVGADSSGFTRDAVVVGDVQTDDSTAIVGAAAVFPAVPGSYLSALYDDGLGIEDAFTISLWFFVDPEDEGEGREVRYALGTSEGTLQVQIGRGKRHMRVTVKPGEAYDLRGEPAWRRGLWQHLAVVYHRGELVSAQVDGSEMEVSPVFSRSLATVTGSGSLVLGARASCPDEDAFDGLMDEVRLYNRALSQCELDTLLMEDDVLVDVEVASCGSVVPVDIAWAVESSSETGRVNFRTATHMVARLLRKGSSLEARHALLHFDYGAHVELDFVGNDGLTPRQLARAAKALPYCEQALRQQGLCLTNTAEALDEAMAVFDRQSTASGRLLVLITDSKPNAPDGDNAVCQRATELRRLAIDVVVVTVGDDVDARAIDCLVTDPSTRMFHADSFGIDELNTIVGDLQASVCPEEAEETQQQQQGASAHARAAEARATSPSLLRGDWRWWPLAAVVLAAALCWRRWAPGAEEEHERKLSEQVPATYGSV